MSDDEDLELLALLREKLGLAPVPDNAKPETGVLRSSEFVYDHSVDVSIVSRSTKEAASFLWKTMQEKNVSTHTWSDHELHPQTKDESTLNFIFTMDLLNFSFWSTLPEDQRFQVSYKSKVWTGYWSLVAILQRALEDGTPITSHSFWLEATDEELRHVFRSSTEEEIPLLDNRIALLRETAHILEDQFDGSVANIVAQAGLSAARFVNLLVDRFPAFRDENHFHNKQVKFYKRAQILVADVWAAFNGQHFGHFEDIACITIFPDYRIPQMLQSLNVLWYSPRLESKIKRKEEIPAGDNLEIEIRGCSIWAIELLRREMVKQHPEAQTKVNAILIDFFLYDTIKEREAKLAAEGKESEMLPHHRTRSIWY